MKILVVSAHPDDETLGAGGTILKHLANGDEVYWCYFTLFFENSDDAYKRKRESIVSTVFRTYGFQDRFFLNFHAGDLDKVGFRDLINNFSDIIRKLKPEIIYTVGPMDVNTDHEYAYKAVMSCTKPSYTPFIRKILIYEVTSSTNWSFPDTTQFFVPNCFCDISGLLEKKVEIMRIYEEEHKEYPHPRSDRGIRAIAEYRGSSINVEFAEAFMIMREIF